MLAFDGQDQPPPTRPHGAMFENLNFDKTSVQLDLNKPRHMVGAYARPLIDPITIYLKRTASFSVWLETKKTMALSLCVQEYFKALLRSADVFVTNVRRICEFRRVSKHIGRML